MQVKIFVSYTTKDDQIDEGYLSEKELIIAKYGHVYIDILHNDSADKQNRVIRELISSDVLLLVKTESIFKSQWVIWELEMAYKKEIPVLTVEFNFAESDIERLFPNYRSKLTSSCSCRAKFGTLGVSCMT